MVQLRGNRVAVEKIKKAKKGDGGGFLVMPDGEEFMGVIRHVGESCSKDLKVDQKVYFSTNYQQVRIAGVDLCILEDAQIYAIVTE